MYSNIGPLSGEIRFWALSWVRHKATEPTRMEPIFLLCLLHLLTLIFWLYILSSEKTQSGGSTGDQCFVHSHQVAV